MSMVNLSVHAQKAPKHTSPQARGRQINIYIDLYIYRYIHTEVMHITGKPKTPHKADKPKKPAQRP